MRIDDLTKDVDVDQTSPKDRIPMIKEVFQIIFNREPSSRELSLYKYGVQTREEIIEKLLDSDEHKENIKNAKGFNDLEKRAKDAEHEVLKLRQQIDDSAQESIDLKNLLKEKNMEIAILRREKEDPYNFTHSEALKYIRNLNENDRNNQTLYQQSKIVPVNKETWIDKIYRLLKF